jgi:dTDP-4-amino-4,6-dideoxygalactose transaminase
MIPIARPLIGEEEKTAVLAVLSSGQLAQGPKVREFEERFAAWAGVRYAVAASSGTAALHLALLAHDLGPGDEVITTPFSFVASANCARFVGARPVFADIEPDYFTLDPEQVARAITPQTRAILPVHLYGQPCDMPALAELAAAHGLIVIEDACQAHGARLNGQPVGAWGTACYSFYPTKNMTTIEGGMLTTNDPAIAERARLLREHGSPKRYQHILLGYNFRMTDVQAALGLVQLSKLDAWNTQRQSNAAYLNDRLRQTTGVVPPAVRPGATHVFHQYTIRIQNREAAVQELARRGIGTGVHYPTPIHQQPLYQGEGYADSLPQAEMACREVLSLPVHPTLTQGELDEIVDAVARLAPVAADAALV